MKDRNEVETFDEYPFILFDLYAVWMDCLFKTYILCVSHIEICLILIVSLKQSS